MKKSILFLAAAAIIGSANSQELKTKAGFPVLPEAGDWALQIDAVPFLNYAGNLMNNTAGNTVNAAPVIPFVITGKYFTDAKTAFRGHLRLGFGSATNKAFSVQDNQTTFDPTVVVEDAMKMSSSNIVIGAGMEKRKGNGRLQGYYGGDFMIGLSSQKTTYEYGNAFSADNVAPTRTDFGSNVGGAGQFTTESKNGSQFGLTLRGFVGAEYFFASKMSIGVEYGWGLNFNTTGEGENTTEEWDAAAATPAVKSRTFKTGGNSAFGIDTDNLGGGRINLTLHF